MFFVSDCLEWDLVIWVFRAVVREVGDFGELLVCDYGVWINICHNFSEYCWFGNFRI